MPADKLLVCGDYLQAEIRIGGKMSTIRKISLNRFFASLKNGRTGRPCSRSRAIHFLRYLFFKDHQFVALDSLKMKLNIKSSSKIFHLNRNCSSFSDAKIRSEPARAQTLFFQSFRLC